MDFKKGHILQFIFFFLVTGDCPPGKKTDNPQGRCCFFPFTYGGVSYDSCTTVSNGNTPWCSLTAIYVGQWANCGKTNVLTIQSILFLNYFPIDVMFQNKVFLINPIQS